MEQICIEEEDDDEGEGELVKMKNKYKKKETTKILGYHNAHMFC